MTERELELSGEEMRRMVDLAMTRIVDHIRELPRMPAADVEGGAALARSLAEPIPETATPYEELLDLLFDRVIPKSFNTAGPGYLAYVPGGGVFHAAVANLISSATNRYVGVFQAAPGLAQIEANVVRWFCGIVGYPSGSGGVLTTGGSIANLIAVVTARRERLPENFLDGVVYTSDQAHHSVTRAAVLAGFPARRIRAIPSDERYRIRIDRLAGAVAQDRKDGLTPFLVVGNAGTTNSGAVDDLEALADLAHRESLWLHVDAAYGGFFALTARGRAVMRGLSRADSITLDPHKGLFMPYGTGSLLTRDAGALRRTHGIHADYMPPLQEDADLVDFCEISPELSRDCRGLRIWLPFRMHGVGAFRDSLDEKLDLAAWAADALRTIPGIEILAEPELSLLAFRHVPPGVEAPEELDEANRRLLGRINARRRVHLTGTSLSGRFAIRICVLSFRTHMDRVRDAVDDIRRAVEETSPARSRRSD